jgi:hypothetical protein
MMRRNVTFPGTAVVNVAHTASHAGQHLMPLPGWQLAYLSTVVTRLSLDHLRKAPPGFVVRRMRINGRLGLVGYFEDGSPHSVTTLDVAGDRVRAIRLVVNPEKLGGVLPLDRAEIVEGPR